MMTYLVAIPIVVIALLLITFWYRIAHGVSLSGTIRQTNTSLIIFDFDGTICPSYPLFIQQVNRLADNYHLIKIEPHEVEDFRNMTPNEIITKLNVSIFKLPFLLKKARHNIQTEILELQPVPAIRDVLYELKKEGYSLGILTSNSLVNVLRYLQKYDLELFDFIYSANNVFGKKKHLKTILKKAPSQIRQPAYIGDEMRDIEASKKAGLLSIGVAWGYNSRNQIQKSDPDHLFQTPSDLLYFIQQKLL